MRSFGPEFRYLDLGDEASPSPANALNRGIAARTRRVVALMIDGAHVLTPGVLHFGMLGLRTYAPAVVATQQWYVGPGEQHETVAEGLRPGLRGPALRADRLARRRLPALRHRALHRGPRLVRRPVGEQLHLRPARAARPGRRDGPQLQRAGRRLREPRLLRAHDDVAAHQPRDRCSARARSIRCTAGRRRTRRSRPSARTCSTPTASSTRRYAGRVFKSPAKVDALRRRPSDAARRTKARRMGAPIYFKLAHVDGDRRAPREPDPVPDELRTEFVDAFWRSKEWQQTPWLGRWTAGRPRDLFAYQELIPGFGRIGSSRPAPVAAGVPSSWRRSATCSTTAVSSRSTTTRCRISSEHPRIEYVRRDPVDGRHRGGDPRARRESDRTRC